MELVLGTWGGKKFTIEVNTLMAWTSLGGRSIMVKDSFLSSFIENPLLLLKRSRESLSLGVSSSAEL